MKQALTIALAAIITIGFSSLTLADRDRGRYDGYNRHHHDHGYREHRRYNKHWKRHHGYHHRPQVRYYAPVPHHNSVIYYHDDDVYKFMGGMYLLNEVLHHDRH